MVNHVEYYVAYIDLTMTTKKLMELFAPLNPEEIDELGGKYYLGLPQFEIDRIQKDYQSPTRRKEAYLDLYVHQHPCPTWNRVAVVLRSWVNLPQQADLVENTYVKGTQDCLYHINSQHCCCHCMEYYTSCSYQHSTSPNHSTVLHNSSCIYRM